MSMEGFLSGVALLALGWTVLDKDVQAWLIQQSIDRSNNSFFGRLLTFSPPSEEVRRKIGAINANILGWFLIIIGLIALFRSLFGLVTFQ